MESRNSNSSNEITAQMVFSRHIPGFGAVELCKDNTKIVQATNLRRISENLWENAKEITFQVRPPLVLRELMHVVKRNKSYRLFYGDAL